MNQSLTVRIAEVVAKTAHAGQVDKAGVPYIEHVLRVASAMSTEEGRVVALLHDVLEDSNLTAVDLIELGFTQAIVDAVVLLTHKKGQPRADYIEAIGGNALATAVKLADLADNMNLNRLGSVTQKDIDRRERYAKDVARLRESQGT